MPRRIPKLALLCLAVAGLAAWIAQVQIKAQSASADSEGIPETGVPATAVPPSGTLQNASPAAPIADANQLLEAAIRTLESRFSVEARFRLRQPVDLYGHQIIGSGTYTDIQPGRNHKYRMEIKLRSGDQDANLIQVCDGRYLWIYRALPEGESLDRVDVASVVNALRDADNLPQPGTVGAWPGFGGLPRLLRGLYHDFQFTRTETDAFQAQDTQGRIQEVPVWKVTGHWRPERLVTILPDQKGDLLQGKPVDLSALPEHVPDAVVVYLGQSTLFPLRIEYRRDSASRYLLVMDWVEVNLNVPIDPNRFLYQPGQVEVADITRQFLSTLDLKQRQ